MRITYKYPGSTVAVTLMLLQILGCNDAAGPPRRLANAFGFVLLFSCGMGAHLLCRMLVRRRRRTERIGHCKRFVSTV